MKIQKQLEKKTGVWQPIFRIGEYPMMMDALELEISLVNIHTLPEPNDPWQCIARGHNYHGFMFSVLVEWGRGAFLSLGILTRRTQTRFIPIIPRVRFRLL